MIIKITNMSTKKRIVTSIDDGKITTYPLEVNEHIEFDSNENLAELECDGTVLFVPNALDSVSYALIEDEEAKVDRTKIDIVFILYLMAMCTITIFTINAEFWVIALFLIIESGLIFAVHHLFIKEQDGNILFFEQ